MIPRIVDSDLMLRMFMTVLMRLMRVMLLHFVRVRIMIVIVPLMLVCVLIRMIMLMIVAVFMGLVRMFVFGPCSLVPLVPGSPLFRNHVHFDRRQAAAAHFAHLQARAHVQRRRRLRQ